MGLKVFNLQCKQGHIFEGWFPSAEDVTLQVSKGLVECPYCYSKQVQKILAAPYVNRSSSRTEQAKDTASKNQTNRTTASSDTVNSTVPTTLEQLQAVAIRELRRIIHRAEDVGDRFAEEALKMHRGKTEERSIRGQATLAECEQLLDEGVTVLPIPAIVDPKKQH